MRPSHRLRRNDHNLQLFIAHYVRGPSETILHQGLLRLRPFTLGQTEKIIRRGTKSLSNTNDKTQIRFSNPRHIMPEATFAQINEASGLSVRETQVLNSLFQIRCKGVHQNKLF